MVQVADFKQQLQESAKALAEILVKENRQEEKLLSLSARRKKIEQEIEHHVEVTTNKMHDGLKFIIESLSQCNDLSMSTDQVVSELRSCFSSIKKAADFSQVGQALLSETSLKTYLGISNKCMEILYRGAKFLFDKKDYISAEQAFFVLCSLDPTQFAYWIGFGHSTFHNRHYQQAIHSYAMASALDPTNIWPHIWAANSFEEEKDFQHATIALQEALILQKEKTPKNHELTHSLEARIKKIQSL